MPDTLNKRFILLLALLTAYNFMFWKESQGLNDVIFSALLVTAQVILKPAAIKFRTVLISITAILLSCTMVIVQNTAFAVFSLIVSLFVFTGFTHQNELKTAYSALMTATLSVFLFPYNVIEGMRKSGSRYKALRFVFKAAKLAMIPAAVFTIFYSLYAYSNPLFNSYSVTFWDEIGSYFRNFFEYYPAARFFFILLGLLIIMAMLYNNNITFLKTLDLLFFDRLRRDKTLKLQYSTTGKRNKPGIERFLMIKPKVNSLISEMRAGVILLVMVNALLAVLNALDINFLWFNFDSKQVDNLAYYVHEGTYVLIFSILLSMAILLYLFRGNLNFYSKNRALKSLALLWIAQNAVMAVSLVLRNVYYIESYYALSYKRIGVMIFILLVFIGLFTMVLKILGKRTAFNIIKINSWAAFAVMLIISSFNWDIAIAKFNLSNPDKSAIDVEYLLSLSDAALPYLTENAAVLNKDYYMQRYLMPEDKNGLEELWLRREEFMKDYEKHSFLSWNYRDWKTYQYYNENMDKLWIDHSK